MEKLKIYHVETQEDYDDLMIELEKQGYLWISGDKPTAKNCWLECQEETVICLNEVINREMRFSSLGYTKREYPEIPIIKHKAKGVNQMEKVVVPQFVADWYEERKGKYTIYGLIVELNKLNKKDNEEISIWKCSCQGRHINKFSNAQEVIAKMHLYGYEVEEEKKYYWRKKKEYLFEFDSLDLSYLRIHRETRRLSFGAATESSLYQALLTETQVRQAVIEEDFNKLERVEIDDVQ